ncbi:MAG TPA: PIN domain-containing protein [Nakamurella sp.]
MSTRVLVDANVLYSRTLRDWLALLYLESDSLFSVYWTEDILAETLYHLRRDHHDWPGHKTRAVGDKIRAVFEGGRVEDFVPDGSFVGPDPHDQHVHAAALACGAGILLTADSGFSTSAASDAESPYELYVPDDFFVLVDDSAPETVRAVVSTQQRYWLTRQGRAKLPQALISAGCRGFADRVRSHLQDIDAQPS